MYSFGACDLQWNLQGLLCDQVQLKACDLQL